MLVVDVRRGYLRLGFDLLLTALFVGVAGIIYLVPLPGTTAMALIGQGAAVALVGGAALLAVYVRRGLPSLPAEPAAATLIEAVEDELGTFPKRA
jgi:hypothetical protein